MASERAVLAGGCFWGAEPEHQDYLQWVPNGYTSNHSLVHQPSPLIAWV